MTVIYPARADAPEEASGDFADLAVDLADHWVVQVQLTDEAGQDSDPALFGPLPPRRAWDLGHDLDARLGGGATIVLDALYPAEDTDSVLAELTVQPAPAP